MKYLFLTLSVLLLSGSSLLVADDFVQSGGGIYESEEQLEKSIPQSNADWGTWVCYSRYMGPYGWGNYYGWANNRWQARNNAVYYCSLQHPDYVNCIITGCYIR